MRTLMHVVLEADEDKGTDYTADAPKEDTGITEEDEKPDTLKASDYGQDAPKDDDEPTDDEGDTKSNEGEEDVTDYGAEAPTDDDATGDEPAEDTTDEAPAENADQVQDTKRNSVLIEDFISLYYLIGTLNEKIGSIDKSNVNINRITHQVMANFMEIRKKIFKYIRYDFSSTNYIGNLYAYNSFIEASKVNSAILRESKVFTDSESVDISSKGRKKP